MQVPSSTANDRLMGRIGQQIDPKDTLNVMYFFSRSSRQSVAAFPDLKSRTSSRGDVQVSRRDARSTSDEAPAPQRRTTSAAGAES